MKSRPVIPGIVLALAIGASPALAAPPPAQSAPAASVSNQDIRSFAATRIDLNRIGATYMAKLKAAQGDVERRQVRESARKAMVAAIRKHGYTLEQFRNLAKAIAANPKLRAKLKAAEPGPP